jgi:hypothetical protein
MRADTAEKVLEKLATGNKVTIVVERQTDGKMRVTSRSYLILCDHLLEVRNGGGRLHVQRTPDDGTPPIERYDPYGLGPSLTVPPSALTDFIQHSFLRTIQSEPREPHFSLWSINPIRFLFGGSLRPPAFRLSRPRTRQRGRRGYRR